MNWKNDDHRLNSSDLEADVSPGHFGFSALLRRAILARQREKCLLVRRRMAGRLRFHTSELVDGTQPAPGPPHAGCHNLKCGCFSILNPLGVSPMSD